VLKLRQDVMWHHAYFLFLPPGRSIVIALCMKHLPSNETEVGVERLVQYTDWCDSLLLNRPDTEKRRKMGRRKHFMDKEAFARSIKLSCLFHSKRIFSRLSWEQ
jgi:hypothetical protein